MISENIDKFDSDDLLRAADWYFRFAFAVSNDVRFNHHPRVEYAQLAWGQHFMTGEELNLSRDQELFAATIGEHAATYLCALQIDSVLEDKFGPSRLTQTTQQTIRTPSVIARCIRNAFAHSPLNPIWLVRPQERGSFIIQDVIQLNTEHLNGRKLKFSDFGGPLAMLKFLRHVRQHVLSVQP
jgi:hypothetical protein